MRQAVLGLLVFHAAEFIRPWRNCNCHDPAGKTPCAGLSIQDQAQAPKHQGPKLEPWCVVPGLVYEGISLDITVGAHLCYRLKSPKTGLEDRKHRPECIHAVATKCGKFRLELN